VYFFSQACDKMPALAPVQAATLDKFLAAWKNQNAKDTVALWSDDFKQRLLPLSLGTPVKLRAEAEAVNTKLIENLTNWKVSYSLSFSFSCACFFLVGPSSTTVRKQLKRLHLK
jgi:hypothetical protein